MRIAVVSDVHVGNFRRFGGPVSGGLNRRCQQVLASLDLAGKTAVARGCEELVVCGDLFDVQNPGPTVTAATMRALSSVRRVCVLRGNHDGAVAGESALGPLGEVTHLRGRGSALWAYESSSTMRWLDDSVSVVEGWMEPYRVGSVGEWLPRELAARSKLKSTPRVRALFLHAGVVDQGTPEWLRAAPDALQLEELVALQAAHAVDATFSGHWHQAREWPGQHVYQVGALCPTGFSDEGPDYGRMIIWDTEADSFEHLAVPGPRFLTLDVGAPTAPVQVLVGEGCSVYVRVRADSEHLQQAQRELEALRSLGVVDGEVLLDKAEIEVAARSAAAAARGGQSLAESLEAFVREMPLAEGVDRAQVLSLSRTYLGG